MLVPTLELLQAAQAASYAVGAFNVYNLEGVKAVITAAEAERSPVMLQVHPSALKFAGTPLLALCLAAAQQAGVPVAVHLDHSTSEKEINTAFNAGLKSVMADGSHLTYPENLAFTRAVVLAARMLGAAVEAELGRLSGTEDGLTVPEYEALLTDPEQAQAFVTETGIDALAVCIGNVHGHYRGEPKLDFDRLARIREKVSVPLVLHGASGLPAEMIRESIRLGVSKFNVNTEVREAYLQALKTAFQLPKTPDLLQLMDTGVSAMQEIIREKITLFGSAGKGS